MAKPDLGTKRVCPDTGRKFYDLNKTPVISPYTGKVVPIAAPAPSRARAEAPVAAKPVAQTESVAPETAEAEFVSLEMRYQVPLRRLFGAERSRAGVP